MKLRVDSRNKHFFGDATTEQVSTFPVMSNFGDGMPLIIEPNGAVDCTAISTIKVAYSQKKTLYDVNALWNAVPKTSSGATPQDTLGTAVKIGLLNTSTNQTEKIWGGYFQANTGNLSAFDNTRSAMTIAQSSCTLAGNWYQNWSSLLPFEVFPAGDVVVSRHDYVFVDWKEVNGICMAVIDWHEGQLNYMPIEIFNTEMSKMGCGSFMPATQQVQNIEEKGIMNTLIDLLQNTLLLLQKLIMLKTTPQPVPSTPTEPKNAPISDTSTPTQVSFLWDTPQNSEHSVRVMCDNFGLSWSNKNIIWACIKQESDFMNYQPDGTPTKHENLNKDGTLSSTDWGIVQINDYYHIGEGKDFPSVDYVMQNPELMVKFMIQMFIEGKLGLWSSFKTGAYLKWLPYVE